MEDYISQVLTVVRVIIDPRLGLRLSTLNGSNVVGFTIVIPSEDLDEVELVTVLDNAIPASVVEVVVGVVDELNETTI